MKRLKKILRWGVFSLGFVIAVLFVVWAVLIAIWNAEFRETIAEIQARGEPMTIAEIVPPYVPPEQNAAVELNKAFALMCGDKPKERYIPGKQSGQLKTNVETLNHFFCLKMKQATAEETKKAFKLVDSPELADIFIALNDAALKPDCNFDRRYEDGIVMLLPNLNEFRASVRLLCLKALAQTNKGDVASAGDTLMTAVKISNHLQNEPILVSQLVRQTCLDAIADSLNNIADNFQIPEKDAQNLIAELGKINTTEPLKKSLIAERICWGKALFDGFVSEKACQIINAALAAEEQIRCGALTRLLSRHDPFLKAFFRKDYCEYLRIMAAYSEICDKPYYSAGEKIKRIKTDVNNIPRYYAVCRLLIPDLTTILERNAKCQTRLAIGKIRLALNIYKGRHAAFPENLEQLYPDILREIPIDELTGQALTYKKEGDKYVLFSTALNDLETRRKRK